MVEKEEEKEIIPPPGIREIADKTAKFIAKSANGLQFEERLREQNRSDPKFGFLNPADPYHRYYKNRVKEFGANPNAQTTHEKEKEVQTKENEKNEQLQQQQQEMKEAVKVKDYDFLYEMPAISAQDLDVVKLTAQFVARNGRAFLTQLASRESRNPQFDFLRQNHSIHSLFNTYVAQYTKVLMPIKSQLQQLHDHVASKQPLLKIAEQRAEQRAHARKLKQERDLEAEAEKRAFAEVDWHDFVVVDTIEFLEGDEDGVGTDFALPVSVQELASLSLVDKSRLLGSNTVSTAAPGSTLPPKPTGLSSLPPPPPPSSRVNAPPPPPPTQDDDDNDQEMDMEDDDDVDEASSTVAPKPTIIPRMIPTTTSKDIKIRANYNPKVGKSSSSTNEPTQLCQVCGQAIKVSEMAEHMRIELLDKKWREQQQARDAKKRDTNLNQVDVAKNLTKLSDYRTDIFGSSGDEISLARKVAEEEAKNAKEKVVWDGHSTSIGATTQKVQLAALDAQYESLMNPQPVVQESAKVGPQLPGQQRPPLPSSIPQHRPFVPQPPSFAAPPGTLVPPPALSAPPGMSASGLPAPIAYPVAYPMGIAGPPGAGPPSFPPPPPPGLSAGGYPGGPPPPPSGSAPPPPGFLSTATVPPPPLGRPREDDSEAQDAKRAKIDSDSHLIPEATFIAANHYPISLQIQDPNNQTHTIPALPLQTTVSQLKDQIAALVPGFPAGKQKLATVSGAFLKNTETLGYYNLRNGEILSLKIQTRGGRK
ncbi:UNVERIFIED_CONTAM: splicing factor 3a, subunit 1 [Siphonaria sp. JEL0065]|nr:splicing factor 3a, subunit 1 [Siphonaria sp. JEL0065]